MQPNAPLAVRLRPTAVDEIVGQRHLLAKGKVLSRIIESGNIPNMIFFGPPGTGKTTAANIAAAAAGKRLHKLNATTASIADIKSIIDELDTFLAQNGVVIYLDEIQYFNKKQQQTLLSYMESGKITLIASTTENPYFYVYPALLSRSAVFEFKQVATEDIADNLARAVSFLHDEDGIDVSVERECLLNIAYAAGGDVRRSLNLLEMAVSQTLDDAGESAVITDETIAQLAQGAPIFHDKDGDSHYDLLSAFQKSIRGSDENAAVYYLARLLSGGDLVSVCRRLMVIAAEDIGLAYPQALSVTQSCVEMALKLGLPEARIPLADAVLLLATAPKSNSGICAIDAAIADINAGKIGDIPAHLKDAHYDGAGKLGRGLTYQYPHSFPNHYIKQQYLPDALRDRVYYEFGDNKTEQAAKAYLQRIRSSGED